MCGWKGETDTSALPSVCLRSKKQFQIDLLGVLHWIHFIAFLVRWWTSSLFERIWFYISEYWYLLDNSDCLLLLLSRDGVLLHMQLQHVSKAAILLIVTYWHYNYLKNTMQPYGQVGEALELSSNPRETRVVLTGNGYLKKSAKLKALLAYLTICDRKENLKEHFFMSISPTYKLYLS